MLIFPLDKQNKELRKTNSSIFPHLHFCEHLIHQLGYFHMQFSRIINAANSQNREMLYKQKMEQTGSASLWKL